jgi:hypothetical protein
MSDYDKIIGELENQIIPNKKNTNIKKYLILFLCVSVVVFLINRNLNFLLFFIITFGITALLIFIQSYKIF